MNCLKVDPHLLSKKIDSKRRDYNYSCLALLTELNIPINIYYQYFLSIEEFKLKNLWNRIIQRWNQMKLNLKDNNDFLTSEYIKGDYHQIHKDMNDEIFNDLLNEFINSNLLKSLFICNCIQNYIYPI